MGLSNGNDTILSPANTGSVAEWLKAPVSKTGIGETLSEVQILPLPSSSRRSFMNLSFQFTAHEVWRAQLADCANAKISIDFENYIFTDTGIGREFIEIFKTKVRAGVRIRLLLDMFGSLDFYKNTGLRTELERAGIELAFFNPIFDWRAKHFLHWLSRRDHRKLLLVDGRIAYLGSVCVDQPMENWLEASVRFESDVAVSLQDSFESLFHSAGRPRLSRKVFDISLGDDISYLSSAPHIGRRIVHKLLLKKIRRARNSVNLVTPYFVPTERLRVALRRAIARGVKVTLLIPERTDSSVVDYANHEYARSLARQGAIVRVVGQMVHAKYCIIDSEWTMIGSANLDNLSMLSNYEHVLVGKNTQVAQALNNNFQKLFNESSPIKQEVGLLERILGLLTRPVHRFL